MTTVNMKFEPNIDGIMKEIAASGHVDIDPSQGTVSGQPERS